MGARFATMQPSDDPPPDFVGDSPGFKQVLVCYYHLYIKFNANGADYSRKKMIFRILEVLPIPTNPTFSWMRTRPKALPLAHHIYHTLPKRFLPSIFRLLRQISHLFRQSTKPFHPSTM
jgi:hypothetical protein